MLGTALQFQNRLPKALESYLHAEMLNNQDFSLLGNIAATLQSLGRVEEALIYYQRTLPHCPEDAGLYNNYGALLGIIGKYEEELIWLEKALAIKPNLQPALINLAGHLQDEGDLTRARDLLQQASLPGTIQAGAVASAPILFEIRQALMLSPVAQSWEQMYDERVNTTQALKTLINTAKSSSSALEQVDVDTSLDRINFYISYHGLNDRSLQDLIMDVYRLYLRIEYFSPHLCDLPHEAFPHWITPHPPASTEGIVGAVTKRRARIGFISKFLGIFEPHGMLLDGVMRYLPREHFLVVGLPVARGDGKPLSPTVASACDEVHTVSLTYSHAQAMLQELRLDVLVFADTLSEPMTHFLAHSRLAPIQVSIVCFYGFTLFFLQLIFFLCYYYV